MPDIMAERDARLTLRLWHETLAALKRLAKRDGRSVSDFVRRLAEKAVAKGGEK